MPVGNALRPKGIFQGVPQPGKAPKLQHQCVETWGSRLVCNRCSSALLGHPLASTAAPCSDTQGYSYLPFCCLVACSYTVKRLGGSTWCCAASARLWRSQIPTFMGCHGRGWQDCSISWCLRVSASIACRHGTHSLLGACCLPSTLRGTTQLPWGACCRRALCKDCLPHSVCAVPSCRTHWRTRCRIHCRSSFT